jgi:oligoendopeptidase F
MAESYMDPEILSIKTERLTGWIERYPQLKVFERELTNLIRSKAHRLSAKDESLLAQVSEIDAAGTIYDALTDSDKVLPNLFDHEGREIQLTDGNFGNFLDSPDRAVRQKAFEAMFGWFQEHNNTLATTYATNVRSDVVFSRIRGYKSSLARALYAINVPESVYHSLVDTVHKNLPKLHRYLALRKKMLGLPELHFWDLYVPLVGEVNFAVTFEEACEIILKAVEPMGEEYVNALRHGLKSRWVDVMESKGKASGAYSGGSYLTDPFMLMNWQDRINSLFTLAHEAGHSMHSYFTRKNQPYQTGGYTLFVAEVASTFNEALLRAYLLRTVEDKAVRRFVVNHALEAFRATLYRQTLFAEFEQLAHEISERDEPLTADVLNALHKGLNEQYYGAEVVIDDLLKYEWSRISHFYRSFYVYQYATGISAATTLSHQVLEEGAPAVARYLNFLKSGSSKDSIDLLRDAGVDFATPAPIQRAFDTFEEYIEEFEKLAK